MPQQQELVAKAQMLIRRPAGEVFETFADPAITSRFWFSKGSGRLEPGRTVRWDWEMYGAWTSDTVKAIERDRRILIEWNGPDNPSLVEWTFEPKESGTFVIIRNWGFRGDQDKAVASALDSQGGFSFVLSSLKAFLEHGIDLKLIEDHNPAGVVSGSKG